MSFLRRSTQTTFIYRPLLSTDNFIPGRIVTRTTDILLRSDGIMQFIVNDPDGYSPEDVRQAIDASEKLGGGKVYPNLIFLRSFSHIDADCRSYAMSEAGNRFTLADAYVVPSQPLVIMANFYLKLNRPTRPTRVFRGEKEAVDWLHNYLK